MSNNNLRKLYSKQNEKKISDKNKNRICNNNRQRNVSGAYTKNKKKTK